MPSHCSEPHVCPPELRDRVMQHSPLTSSLDAAGRAAFDSQVVAHAWAEGEPLYTQGEPLRGLYMVMSGVVRLTQATDQGHELTVDLCGEGDVLGAMMPGEVRATTTAWASTTVCCLFLPAEKLTRMVGEHPQVGAAMLHLQQRTLQEAQTRKVHNATARVRSRVLETLGYLDGKFGRSLSNGGRILEAPIRREDIAGIAGTTLESTSREMSTLIKAGIVAPGRQRIELLKPLPEK